MLHEFLDLLIKDSKPNENSQLTIAGSDSSGGAGIQGPTSKP